MSLITSFTRPVGDAQIIPVMPLHAAVFTGAGALTANAAYLHKFRVSKSVTISAIKVMCSANASGFNGDAGIFTLVGGTYTLQRSSGSTAVAAATTGELTFALSAPLTLQSGTDYWMAFAADSATPTFVRIVPASSARLISLATNIAKTATMPLATFSSPGTANAVLDISAI